MTKEEFFVKYEISDAMPIDPSRRAISVEGIATGICEFMNAKFGGIVDASVDTISSRMALVCPDYLAYFLKTLITAVHGRELIHIRMCSTESKFIIMICGNSKISLDIKTERELIRLARNAGFNVSLRYDGIELSAKLINSAVKHVYAISVLDGRKIIVSSLVEIFCHGELMSTEPAPPGHIPEPINKKARSKTKK